MQENAQPFEVALGRHASGEPLHHPHGSEPPALIVSLRLSSKQYLGGYAEQKLEHYHFTTLLALGRQGIRYILLGEFQHGLFGNPGKWGGQWRESNCMGKVSRHLFEALFPRWPADEVPVGHVTNGVHTPSWDSAAADDLWTEGLWERPLAADDRRPWSRTFAAISDASLWQFRARCQQVFC